LKWYLPVRYNGLSLLQKPLKSGEHEWRQEATVRVKELEKLGASWAGQGKARAGGRKSQKKKHGFGGTEPYSSYKQNKHSVIEEKKEGD
jgi:hypothetical protein